MSKGKSERIGAAKVLTAIGIIGFLLADAGHARAAECCGPEWQRQEEINRQRFEEFGKRVRLASLYNAYLTFQLCSERFEQFGSVATSLGSFLKQLESNFSTGETEAIWNDTAEKFRNVEKTYRSQESDSLYSECKGFLALVVLNNPELKSVLPQLPSSLPPEGKKTFRLA
jgi:hypothetical protein